MKKQFLIISAVVLSVCGCGKTPVAGPDTPDVTEPLKIPINLSTDIWSKATDSGFEVNDKVGIYTVNYVNGAAGTLVSSGNHLDNVSFTYNGSLWNPETPVYWKDETTPADFYCYYPYTGSVGDVTALAFSVKEDQSTLANYKASELLWGKTEGAKPSADPVNITTRHAMSNLIIYVVPGNGYTEETLAAETVSVSIASVMTSAKINLATGKVSATGAAGTVAPYKESSYWRALIVPQDVVGAELVKVTVGEKTYTLNQTVSFESNKQYKCTITVNRVSEGVNIGIGGWEKGEIDFGGTVE